MKYPLTAGILLFGSIVFGAEPEAPVAPERVALWQGRAPVGDGKFEEADATITVHRPAKGNGAAVVICPGGGYARQVVGPEGHGIAEWLNRHGIAGVVLEYRLPAGRSFVPLLDAQRALRTVRARAAWSSWLPWEKFIRTASTPASISALTASGVEVAGPIVATIFVRRLSTIIARPD